MTTDDFLLDQLDRSQRDQTRRRRDKRSHRRRLYVVSGVVMLAILVLAGPSLISHSSIGQSMAKRSLAEFALEGDVASIRIGWVTPLRINGLRIQGAAGSEVNVEQLDIDMTAMDILRSSGDPLGQITIRGVDVACTITDQGSSLESDLQPWLASSQQENSANTTLNIKDVTVAVTDQVSGDTWFVTQSNVDVVMTPQVIQAEFSGVLTEPGGSGGSLQGSVELSNLGHPADFNEWRLDIQSESLPLSVVSLLRRRFPDSAASIPRRIHGAATGSLSVVGNHQGAIETSIRSLKIRNLTAAEEGSRVWSNGLASLEGDLTLVGNRVIGRRLRASTDFATATIDGAFSRTFSLVGAHDNPLRWLEAIDGTATVEIDLAALDRSLPGILPLREEAQIVSGKIVARVDSTPVDSTPGAGSRRSQLTIHSDTWRARSSGQPVVIDPIYLSAAVSSDQGQIRADQFDWKSAFGSAVGQGGLRAGNANFEIDFGRLTAMLRPVIRISETSLAGTARGTIRWNAAANDVWRLSGDGSASNLLVTLPNGQSLRRPSMRAEVEAIGQWGGQSLQELTSANVKLTSNGLKLNAELIQAVTRPSAEIPLPIRVTGSGRIETLAETLGPWLPEKLHDASGAFRMSLQGETSTLFTRLHTASIDVTEPRVAYGDRYFSQPAIKVLFDGSYSLPSGDLQARTFTIAGDAFSMAAQGKWGPGQWGPRQWGPGNRTHGEIKSSERNAVMDNPQGPVSSPSSMVDLQVRWRAKLERIQGSVQTRIATRNANRMQNVGYRQNQSSATGQAIETDDWLVKGDCEGEFSLTSHANVLDIKTQMTATDLAVLQPSSASEGFQTIGPMPRQSAGTQAKNSQPTNSVVSPAGSRVVWAEPNLQVNGVVQYDELTGELLADQVQVAGDWFATTLTGNVIWNETTGELSLQGPARLQMNEVADRLSTLVGTPLRAEGVHETPLSIRAQRLPDATVELLVIANLGWETAEVAGVVLGRANIPIELTETTVAVSPARIPVLQGDVPGNVNVSGQVHYRPGPLWMRVDRGVIAESVRLTPEMTHRWLKYLAPMAADTAQISGTVGAEIDEAVIVFDQPQQSRVIGRLNIGGVQMNAGPLANQIIGGIDQLKSIAGGESDDNPTLITMPVQTVDFSVNQGVVSHQRLFLEIDRAQVVTSGRVTTDGRLEMIAQIPLDPRWFGRDLQALAGQTLTLPIDGTLARPSLDSRAFTRVVTQLGTKAVQGVAENYIQKQFTRGLDKIFGR